jgi:hypothetical protein
MTKKEFEELPTDKRRELARDALIAIIMTEEMGANFQRNMLSGTNLEVMKIVLGAYMNGEIE